MLTSVDVKFNAIVHAYREVSKVKGLSGLQIYFK